MADMKFFNFIFLIGTDHIQKQQSNITVSISVNISNGAINNQQSAISNQRH
jgi:hypothetical protein